MDNFNIFTEKDKSDISYGACVAGSALVGAGVGRFLGLQGLLAGAGAGLIIGLISCRKLKEPIKKKIFSKNSRLTEHELSIALSVIRDETGVSSKSDAMFLLGVARQEFASKPGAYNGNKNSPQSMRQAAKHLLVNKGMVNV